MLRNHLRHEVRNPRNQRPGPCGHVPRPDMFNYGPMDHFRTHVHEAPEPLGACGSWRLPQPELMLHPAPHFGSQLRLAHVEASQPWQQTCFHASPAPQARHHVGRLVGTEMPLSLPMAGEDGREAWQGHRDSYWPIPTGRDHRQRRLRVRHWDGFA